MTYFIFIFLDEVHDLRRKYAADIVHLIVEQPIVNCGRANIYSLYQENRAKEVCADEADVDACIRQQRKDRYQRRTFSVSAISEGCRVQNVLTHELGHNFGLYHNRYANKNSLSLTDPIQFPYTPYGFGYVNQNFSRSECSYTIMASGRQCRRRLSLGCTRTHVLQPRLAVGKRRSGLRSSRRGGRGMDHRS